MAGKSTVRIEILGDSGPAQKMFSGLEKSAGGLTGVFGKVGSAMGGVAKIAGGFVVGQALMALPGLLSGAADKAVSLEQNARKAATVFGDQLGSVQAWAEESASGMGLTNQEAVTLAAGMADLLIPMGMSREAAAKMSTETVGLAGALSEWSGGQTSASEAADILTKAYLGETDGLKSLGISISAADVEARLLAKGQNELTGSALEQARALAIQELVMEKSTDAQNSFATSTDDTASKQAALTAKINTLKERLATGIMPIVMMVTGLFLKLAGVLEGPLSAAFGVIESFGAYISAVFNRDLAGMGAAWQSLPAFIQPVAGIVKNVIGIFRELLGLFQGESLSEDFASQFTEIAASLVGIGQTIIGKLAEWGMAFVNFIAPYIPPMLEKLMELATAIATWAVEVALPWLITAIQGWATAFIAWIQPMIPPMLERLGELLTAIGSWVVDTGLPLLLEKFGQWADALGGWIAVATPPVLVKLREFLEAAGTWIADEGLPLLGEKLQLLGQALVDWIGPRIVPTLEALGAFLLAIGGWIVGVAAPAIAGKLIEWGAQFVAWIQPQIGPMLEQLGSLLSALGSWLTGTALPAIISNLSAWGAELVAWVAPRIGPLLSELGSLLAQVGGWLIGTALPAIISQLAEWGMAFVAWVAPQIPPLLAELGRLLVDVGAWLIGTALPEIITKLAQWGLAFLEWVAKDVLPYLGAKLAAILVTVGSWIISDGLPALLQAGRDLGGAVIDGVANGISAAFGTLTAALDSIVSAARGAINSAIRIINQGISAINGALSFTVPGWDPPGPLPPLPAVTVDPPDIPMIPELAEGAVVMPTRDGTVVRVAEAGKAEAVIPLDDPRARTMLSRNPAAGMAGMSGPVVVLMDSSRLMEWVANGLLEMVDMQGVVGGVS